MDDDKSIVQTATDAVSSAASATTAAVKTVAKKDGDDYVVEIYAPLPAAEQLRSARSASAVTMNVIENASEVGRARQAEVGSGNRFAARMPPTGLGIKE